MTSHTGLMSKPIRRCFVCRLFIERSDEVASIANVLVAHGYCVFKQ